MNIDANALYSGGGIWLFYGKANENYFLTNDYGCTLILKNNPNNDWDECLMEEWQKENLIKELMGNERKNFLKEMITDLRKKDFEKRGCITDREIDYYENYWKELGTL